MWNLLSNALKFTPEGGCVQVELAGRDGQVQLRVSDNGLGLPPGEAEMEARATDAEARAGAGPMAAIDALMDALLPAEVRTHMRAARKEQLLAIRSMVDIWIERVDRKPEERRAFEMLTKREREVAVLLYVKNLTLREIGEILGVSESRVCQIHSQLKRTLKQQLAADGMLFSAVG